jgi:beta-mannosidase
MCRRVLAEQFPDVSRRIGQINNLYQYGDRLFCNARYLGIQEKDVDNMLESFNRAEYAPKQDERSLDMVERERYAGGRSPAAEPCNSVALSLDGTPPGGAASSASLDGNWKMKEDTGAGDVFSDGFWRGAPEAHVPGSVHSALEAQGFLPDSTVECNQREARAQSYKSWWFLREFAKPSWDGTTLLRFEGVCDRASFILNGHCLGHHQGMFGGPEFDVTLYLKEENRLLVRLEAVPAVKGDPLSEHPDAENASWKDTVVVNNAYGWHYSHLQPLGIWRSVRLEKSGEVLMDPPFIFTKAIHAEENGSVGRMGLLLDFYNDRPEEGTLRFQIRPENFDGEALYLKKPLSLHGTDGSPLKQGKVRRHTRIALEFDIRGAKLWWPVDLGLPHCYRLELEFTSDGGQNCRHSSIFGVRTVEMASPDNLRREEVYDWIFTVNRRRQFVKGAGWCTMDAEMRFPREKYERFLTLARRQHVQMLRAWGGGMPETDDFYELCDLNGIMVMQEWPTMADSHLTQPYDTLRETVYRNTLRLRNHPSLVMWGAGNESPNPCGDAINMMGRLSAELDGTRPFHAGEPWGGSLHDYLVWWHWRHFDYNLTLTARFLGEFGLCCMPGVQSVGRYLPQADFDAPPPLEDGAFRYHNPVFGRAGDVERLKQYAEYFLEEPYTFRQFIFASQLSQIVGVRHTLERARIRWPESAGALYYKLNDNFPAASWSTVDWYGAAKAGYYAVADAFAPLSAVAVFDSVRLYGSACDLPIFLLDDADSLENLDWRVQVRAFSANLTEITRAEYAGRGRVSPPHQVGALWLSSEQTRTAPLFVVAEIWADGRLRHRNHYLANFEYAHGCVFKLPETRLTASVTTRSGGAVIEMENIGDRPAVMVSVECAVNPEAFLIEDNLLWLDPGERAALETNAARELSVSALNSAATAGRNA